jgi:DNA-binding NarL/FixJ family response regulator
VSKTRILLGDDHTLILDAICHLLESHYEVVGIADNGKKLVELALQLAPEVIVLDVGMPILNGIDAARQIKRELPDTKFVFLSMQSSPIYVRTAQEAGASAYVLKSGAFRELLSAIEAARTGRAYLSPGLERTSKSIRPAILLTDRQRQVLQLIAEGKQNKEVAKVLGLSVKTAEFHRSALMTKLGMYTVAELTRFALQEGLITTNK